MNKVDELLAKLRSGDVLFQSRLSEFVEADGRVFQETLEELLNFILSRVRRKVGRLGGTRRLSIPRGVERGRWCRHIVHRVRRLWKRLGRRRTRPYSR